MPIKQSKGRIVVKGKRSIQRELDRARFRVAIFGSARIRRDDPSYKEVFRLAKMLGAREIDVVTGGGPGLMDAANAGHHAGRVDSKTRSIGLNIRLPKEQRVNKHLDVKTEFSRFSRRLDNFMYLSNAVVVAPGGVGTLLELFYTWQLVQVEHICDMPIILLGDQWPPLIKWLEKWPLKRRFFDKSDLYYFFLAKKAEDAVAIVDQLYTDYKKGRKNFCLNYKKYRL